jgi:hypothetical protein
MQLEGATEMTLIKVPRPPQSARNPNRPVSALLIAQISHLQHAERRLPLKYRSQIYVHAIQTEGEAATYIRKVTEAILKAHKDAATQRAKRTRKPIRGTAIAAAADRQSSRKRASRTKGKKKSASKPAPKNRK